MKTIITFTLLTALTMAQDVHGGLPSDSTKVAPKSSPFSTTLTLRTHSKGLFSFMGRLVSDHPAADIYFNLTHSSGFGFQAFKAADLGDSHGANNFAMAMVFRHFKVTPRVTLTPYAGIVLEQSHSMADHGSDISSMLTTSVKLTPRLTFEHMSLFPNLVLVRANSDWVNRFKLMYTRGHVDMTMWAWHNNRVFDSSTYTSAGLSVYYARMPITRRLSMAAGVTGLVMAASSNHERVPMKNSALLTIAATWHN